MGIQPGRSFDEPDGGAGGGALLVSLGTVGTQRQPVQLWVAAGSVRLNHTLPEEVRFSANGLVLDGGTVW